MNKDCKQAKENLLFFIEGSLKPGISIQVHKHLEECNECQSSYLNLKSAFSIIEQEKIKESHPYFSIKVLERLRRSPETDETSKAFHIRRILQPALAFLLIGAAIYTGILLGGHYSQKDNTASINDSGEIQLQTLADEYYLNDLEVESIETILITNNN